jgi:hypothetical protein
VVHRSHKVKDKALSWTVLSTFIDDFILFGMFSKQHDVTWYNACVRLDRKLLIDLFSRLCLVLIGILVNCRLRIRSDDFILLAAISPNKSWKSDEERMFTDFIYICHNLLHITNS